MDDPIQRKRDEINKLKSQSNSMLATINGDLKYGAIKGSGASRA
jgi:hypothetical protein